MATGAGTEGGASAPNSPQQRHHLLSGNVTLEQLHQETVGLEMTSAPASYSGSTPSDSEPTIEIKRVSGCGWLHTADSGGG